MGKIITSDEYQKVVDEIIESMQDPDVKTILKMFSKLLYNRLFES